MAEIPLRFAQHLVREAMNVKCDLTSSQYRAERCPHLSVGMMWEHGFADSVCEEHAEKAKQRGALVVYAKIHDGTE